jgi:transposase
MTTMAKREPRARRQFSDDYKANAVRLVLDEGMPIRRVAADLDLTPSSVDRWVKQAKEQRGLVPTPPVPVSAALDANERAELEQLRRRVRELEIEKTILKKAAAFFAKESA